MKNIFNMLILCLLSGFAGAQLVSSNAFLKGQYIEVGIAPKGYFGTTINAPAGYHTRGGGALGFIADPAKDGWSVGSPAFYGDYFLPGSPEEGWAIQFNGNSYNNNGAGPTEIDGSIISVTDDGTNVQAIWQGTRNGLEITSRTYFPKNALYFVTEVTIKNTSSSTIGNVYYMRNVDPDQEASMGGSFTTNNSIAQQNPNSINTALVTATGIDYGAFLGLGARDCRARVTHGGFSNRSPIDIWNNVGLNNSGTRSGVDEAISISFKIGDLAPGQSTKIAYAYILSASQLDLALGSTVTGFQDTNGSNINTGASISSCLNTSFPLKIENGDAYSWSWSPSTGLNTTIGSSVTATLFNTTPIKYTATGNGICGTLNVEITLAATIPELSLTTLATPSAICSGVNNSTISANLLGGTSPYTYSWSDGIGEGQSKIVSPNSTKTYTVTATDKNGCSKNGEVTVFVGVLPDPTITSSTPQSVCSGATLALSGSSTGGTSPTYAWSASGGVFVSNQQNPTFTVPTVGNYTVTLTVLEGVCSATATVAVTITLPPVPTVSVLSCSANPTKVWEKKLGGNSYESLTKIVELPDGNLLWVGASVSPISGDKTVANSGGFDAWVIKTNASGNTILWQKTYGGTGHEGGDFKIDGTKTNDGGAMLVMSSTSGISGNKTTANYGEEDIWVIKIDADGNLIRQWSFGGAGRDDPNHILATSDGGFVISGVSYSAGGTGNKNATTAPAYGDGDFWIIKLNPNATNPLAGDSWQKTIGGTLLDAPTKAIETATGELLIAGYSKSTNNGNKTVANFDGTAGLSDYYVIKLSADGTQILWQQSYGGAKTGPDPSGQGFGDDYASSITKSNTAGRYVIGGTSKSQGGTGNKTTALRGSSDGWIIEINEANGSKTAEKTIGGVDQDDFYQVVTLPNGTGYWVTMRVNEAISQDITAAPLGMLDFWVAEIDNDFSVAPRWDRRYGGVYNERPLNAIQTQSGDLIFLGVQATDAANSNGNSQDYFAVKIATCAAGTTATTCAGTSVTLYASGCSGTINWSSGGAGSSIVVTPTMTTNYTATCTQSGCTSGNSNTATINIDVPTATITASNTCIGQSVALSTTAGFSTYSWANSGGTFTSTTNQATFSHDATGGFVFTVTATNSNGCTATTTASLTVNALPTASISLSSAAVCAGTPVNLTATAGLSSYSWSSSGGTFTSTSNQATLGSSSSAGGYSFTVTFTNSNGCSATATASATVNELPVVSISPPVAVVCTGQTLNLTATAGLSSYSWSSSGGTFTSTTNLATFSSTIGGGYSFTVTATNSNSCSATASASATVNTSASVSILPANAVVCAGKPVNLTATAGFSSYSWANSGGTFTSTTNKATFSSSISGGYSYSVTAINGSGCTATATASVTVRAVPTASISLSSAAVCVGQSINLTATAGLSSYSWSSSGGTFSSTSNQATLSSSSSLGGYSFTVTVTNSNSCSNTTTVSATVNALPVVSILPANTVLCIGQSVNLTATTGLSSYSWASSGAFTSTTNQATFNSTNPGGYSFSVTVSNGTCTNTASTSLTMNALPAVSISQANSQVCVGTALSLSATTGLGSYSWANSGGAFTSTTNKATFSSSTPATNRFTVTAGNGTCINTATTSVQVMPSFTVSLSVAPICVVGNPLNLSVVGGNNYLWKGPNGFRSTNATPSKAKTVDADDGIYSITVTGNAVCTVTSTIEVYFGVGKIMASSNSPVCKGGTIKLSATAAHGGGASYKWTKQLGSTVYTGQNPTIPNAKTSDGGIYVVFVTGQNGCIVKEEVLVTVNPIACGSGRLASGEDAEKGIRLTLYPNPTQGKLVVAVQMDKAASIELDLLDMVGIPKLHWKTVEETSEYRAELDISTFAEGMYLLRAVSSNQKQATVKVVKIN